MFQPEGVYAAMLTPFNEDGSINETVQREMVDFLIEKGVHGLFPVSTSGEFVHMTAEQKARQIEIVVDQARGRVPVTPGTGASCPEEVIELSRYARKMGCEAVVVCGPYYYQVSQEIVERHFEVISDALDIPIILYHVPQFANPISHVIAKRLARRENIVAIKDSSGLMINTINLIDKVNMVRNDFAVLTGSEEILLPTLAIGGRGCMVATAGVLPETMVGIYDNFKAGNLEEARKLQFSILPLVRAMKSVNFPIGFKAAMDFRGFEMGSFKQPLSEADEYTYLGSRARIGKLMRQLVKNG
ncbi:MAG: dihydrodipicolinate synthase family protein [Eubacteriales bacterium]